MCRWKGSHFYDWINYHGVTFLVWLLEWGRTFFWISGIILVSRDLKIGRFTVKNGSCCFLIINSRLTLNSVHEITT